MLGLGGRARGGVEWRCGDCPTLGGLPASHRQRVLWVYWISMPSYAAWLLADAVRPC